MDEHTKFLARVFPLMAATLRQRQPSMCPNGAYALALQHDEEFATVPCTTDLRESDLGMADRLLLAPTRTPRSASSHIKLRRNETIDWLKSLSNEELEHRYKVARLMVVRCCTQHPNICRLANETKRKRPRENCGKRQGRAKPSWSTTLHSRTRQKPHKRSLLAWLLAIACRSFETKPRCGGAQRTCSARCASGPPPSFCFSWSQIRSS